MGSGRGLVHSLMISLLCLRHFVNVMGLDQDSFHQCQTLPVEFQRWTQLIFLRWPDKLPFELKSIRLLASRSYDRPAWPWLPKPKRLAERCRYLRKQRQPSDEQ